VLNFAHTCKQYNCVHSTTCIEVTEDYIVSPVSLLYRGRFIRSSDRSSDQSLYEAQAAILTFPGSPLQSQALPGTRYSQVLLTQFKQYSHFDNQVLRQSRIRTRTEMVARTGVFIVNADVIDPRNFTPQFTVSNQSPAPRRDFRRSAS